MIISPNITIRNGACVGGGSVVYNAIMLQPTRELFRLVFPPAIDFDELDEVYYPRVRSILRCSEIPSDILNSPYYLSTRVNLQQAQNAGFITRPNEFNVNWDIVRDEINGKRVPSAIAGQAWFGLNSGAKNSVDRNYLPLAERTGRVEILTRHVVTDISFSHRYKLYTVTANIIDTNGIVQKTVQFTTPRVFMGAGSLGTAALLTKARAKGTLPNLSSATGQGWGNNGDFIVFRGTGVPDNAGQGGPCGHFLMQDVNNKFSPTNMIELVVPRSDAVPGSPLYLSVDSKVASSLYVGLGVAPPVGYFTYDGKTDAATLNWPASIPTDSPLFNWSQGAASLDTTLDAANPGSFTAFFANNLTAHPVGGAGAGTVCDFHGRVKGYKGLYVVDGAFIPGGSVGGVNPSFTIAALAERNMERIIGDVF
jgi:cholesterol oxidase